MGSSQRRVISEITKVWENAVAKGKLVKPEERLSDLTSWIREHPTLSSIQNKVTENVNKLNKFDVRSTDIVTESTRHRVSRLMSAYEELIGISEVKGAHARVLTTEAKFIEYQEQRRLASKQLTDIQDRLFEIRAELDRTQRGNDAYLDLIKKEIDITKAERIIRKHFEELERTEREVFSELSSALRFSHEKERAQNEKTKYWSIVGSIVGASLGVLGSTVNNKMKQNHLKHVLGETTTQIASIQTTVEGLTKKINEGSLSSLDETRILERLKAQEQQLVSHHENMSQFMLETINSLQHLMQSLATGKRLPDTAAEQALISNIDTGNYTITYLIEQKWHLTAIACCAVSVLLYKFV